MTTTDVRAAVHAQLARHGHPVTGAEHDADLIGLGVSSVTLIQVLSALEDAYGIDFDMERLFSAPVTAARLEAEITRGAAHT
jgi:acyl carrier protein